jgi:nitrilase
VVYFFVDLRLTELSFLQYEYCRHLTLTRISTASGFYLPTTKHHTMATPRNSKILVATAQVHTQHDLASTLQLLKSTTETAASKGTSIILFPEAFLGGYPRSCSFGSAVGSRTDEGREQYLAYHSSCVDLGDTFKGEGDDWLERRLPGKEVNGVMNVRGDGTREFLESVAAETGVFIVTGLVERCGGSLFCAALFVDPTRGVIGKRRKLMPTASERLVWSIGSPSTLKAVVAEIQGVRVVIGCAICWENYMPLLRYSLYAQGVNLWLAPTADQRPTWKSLMETIANEGRCWVVSGNQCIKRKNLPGWITAPGTATEAKSEAQVNGVGSEERKGSNMGRRLSTTKTEENHEIAWRLKHDAGSAVDTETVPEDAVVTSPGSKPVAIVNGASEDFASRGGSLIVSPLGQTVAGPLWENDNEVLYTEVDLDECVKGKLDFDVVGHYSRNDVFKLNVEGLDLVPA